MMTSAAAGTQMADPSRAPTLAEQAVFLHSVAHELSTPLTPIVGYLKILLSGKLGALTDQQRRILESMGHSADHLSLIIDNLVDLADLEAGQTELRLAKLDVTELFDRCLSEAREAGRSKRLSIERALEGPAMVRADEVKLKQALQNLLENAVKFSPHGGVVLGELCRRGDGFELAIYDQGSGMDVAQLDVLSRPFCWAATAYPARRPGAGLGLPVARRIAEAHGGELRAESPPQGQPLALHHFAGTRVSIVLPSA
ncbi:MAG: sensor histidine kinase [Deltaproteobacteria bacterium]